MPNAEQKEAQARIKIPGRNINNLRYADDITLIAESEEESAILPPDRVVETDACSLWEVLPLKIHSVSEIFSIQKETLKANNW